MREILFRGKREYDNEWVYGHLVIESNEQQPIIVRTLTFDDYEDDEVDEQNIRDFYYYYVIPETVCQFTGLYDKNGRKIFEGDVILYHHKVKKLVPCEDATQEEIQHYGLDHDTGLGLAYRPTKTIRYKGYVTVDNLWGLDLNLTNNCKWWLCEKNGQLTSVEIIGNIYDNPELMEVRK